MWTNQMIGISVDPLEQVMAHSTIIIFLRQTTPTAIRRLVAGASGDLAR
jgi:hypothetical protein